MELQIPFELYHLLLPAMLKRMKKARQSQMFDGIWFEHGVAVAEKQLMLDGPCLDTWKTNCVGCSESRVSLSLFLSLQLFRTAGILSLTIVVNRYLIERQPHFLINWHSIACSSRRCIYSLCASFAQNNRSHKEKIPSNMWQNGSLIEFYFQRYMYTYIYT